MSETTSAPRLYVGKNPQTEEDVSLPVKALKKHIAIFGQSGSGKTVSCKVVIEEAVRNNIPAIIIDPQGDISSLTLIEEWEKLEKYGVNKEFYEEFKDKLEVVIFTPASEKGIPLSINPLIVPPGELDREEKILALDGMATNLVDVLGYKLTSNKGKAVTAYLSALFQSFTEKNVLVQDFQMLIDLIQADEAYLSDSYRSLLSKKDKMSLVNNIKFLTVGAQSLVFNLGPKVSIPDLIRPSEEGKVRISIIYLNTLTSQKLKSLYISTVSQRLYTYMLSNPSHEPQLIFYIDELSGLIPPYPRNPPTKKWLQLLFKQGRKYGVSMLVATQNISDVDYKAFGQVSTFFFGRFMAPQDLKTVEKMLQAHPSAHFIIDELPALKPGEFYLLSPDNFKKPIKVKMRWLYTEHHALSDDDVLKLYKEAPPVLCKIVGDYDYDARKLDLSNVDKILSLDEIEKELEKIDDFTQVESLIDQEVDIAKLDEDFPEPELGISGLEEESKEVTKPDSKTIVREKTVVHKIDLTKALKSIKERYLKYETIDFRELLKKFFGDTEFSYMGTNSLQLAYVPMLLIDFTIQAKRLLKIKVANEIKEEEVTLDLPIKRIYPLIDRLEFNSEKDIWGEPSIPIQAEEVFEELLSILPLKNMNNLFASPSSDIMKINIQRQPRIILESFEDILLNDQSMYREEWKRDIEDELIRIEQKYQKDVDKWVGELEAERDSLFAGLQEKRSKIKRFQARIEEAKGIYASLKPIMTDKYKYKREVDVEKYNKAVETLKYGPQVIKNITKEVEKDIVKIKELDKQIKAFPKVYLVDDIEKIVENRNFTIPKEDEIKDIYGAIIYIPTAIAELNIINGEGQDLLVRGVAESTLGTTINIVCDTCLEKHSPKIQIVSTPNFCSVCGRALCSDHSISCAISGDTVCYKHSVVCSTCKKVVSTKHAQKCEFCENMLCDNDIIRCQICGKVICKKHAKKVTKKGLFKTESYYVCPDHAKK